MKTKMVAIMILVTALALVFSAISFAQQKGVKIENGIVSFPEEIHRGTTVNLSKLKFIPPTSVDTPKEVKESMGKIWGGITTIRGIPHGGSMLYAIPLGYDSRTGNISVFLFGEGKDHKTWQATISGPFDPEGYYKLKSSPASTVTFRLYFKKGTLDFRQENGPEAYLSPVAEFPIPEPAPTAPKKEPGKIKVENGYIVFPQESMPDVSLKDDLNTTTSVDTPEDIQKIQGKIYSTIRGEKEKTICIIPDGYDSESKKIRALFITDNKGTKWKPDKVIIEGIYNKAEGSAVKYVTDKSDRPWASLHILPEKDGFKLRLSWSTGGNTDLFPIAEFANLKPAVK